ncbi:hypothetical protein ABZX90_39165 [Streptomyces sp. NPDC002935]|uniref:hypothetical protein n=1 Tax=Streptomyces sp. NPDC002935 TaxID=3154545 RepID=UPI0033BEC3E8
MAETLAGLPSAETSTWSAHGIRLIGSGLASANRGHNHAPVRRHVDRGQEFNGGDGVTLTGPGTGDEDGNIGNSER